MTEQHFLKKRSFFGDSRAFQFKMMQTYRTVIQNEANHLKNDVPFQTNKSFFNKNAVLLQKNKKNNYVRSWKLYPNTQKDCVFFVFFYDSISFL